MVNASSEYHPAKTITNCPSVAFQTGSGKSEMVCPPVTVMASGAATPAAAASSPTPKVTVYSDADTVAWMVSVCVVQVVPPHQEEEVV